MRDATPKLLVAILAGGASRRLGRPKQLVEIDGEPLIRRQCRVAMESNVGEVVVIVGCHARECATAAAAAALGAWPAPAVRVNEHWEEGLASSIREAVRAAIDAGAPGLMLVHGDQFALTSADLRALQAAWLGAGGAKACRSWHEDYLGPPVILPARCFDAAMRLRGDDGARDVLRALGPDETIQVHVPSAVHDLDEPAQLDQLADASTRAWGAPK
jgi:CTP:molybdopterin cytidylyltransferase MocA